MIEEIKHLKEQAKLTDRQVIGSLFQKMDEGKEFVEGDNNYVWFYHMGQHFRPKVIAEMGTRFGYSLKCFVDGAGHRPEEYSLWSYDMECDGIKTLDTFESYFRNTLGIQDLHVHKVNTRDITSLGLTNADLVFVDGDHTKEGCIHECTIGWEALRSGGVMVIDDLDNPAVKTGTHLFCFGNHITPHYLSGLRDMCIVIKP